MYKNLGKVLLYSGREDQDAIHLRPWFVVYLSYLAALVVLTLLSLQHHAHNGHTLAQHGWLLCVYLFYMSLCCTFFPAPTAWLVLLMASPVIGLVDPMALGETLRVSAPNLSWASAVLTIVVVAGIGALGTSMANLNEYHIFTFLLRIGRAHKVRETGWFQTAARWFSVSPFTLMTVVSFLPIPVDVVRWLAITHRYRRDRFFLAYFVGRFFRYSLLATAATCFKISWLGIIIIQLTLIGLVCLRYIPKILSHDAKPTAASLVTEKVSS